MGAAVLLPRRGPERWLGVCGFIRGDVDVLKGGRITSTRKGRAVRGCAVGLRVQRLHKLEAADLL